MNYTTITKYFLSALFTMLYTVGAQSFLPPEKSGEFYVSSYGNDKIAVYDSGGTYLRSLTPDGLDGTRGIVFDTEGNFYVSSQLTNEVLFLIKMINI